EYSYPELGSEFGGRDHSTMMHSHDKIENAIKVDSSLDTTIQQLIRDIKDHKK
ncbi:MAG: chromosomal replication initiator protein DnaA, partial [Treponemataceae bacterium]|nr:chromosomal replication initiator protein DnaA [Treponemataceae bacterium]